MSLWAKRSASSGVERIWRSALVITATLTVAMAGFATAVQAQDPIPPPTYSAVDGNGVDLLSGQISVQQGINSIGPSGPGGLRASKTMRAGYPTLSMYSYVRLELNGNGIEEATVVFMGRSERFSGPIDSMDPVDATSSTLVQSGTSLVYTLSDGTVGRFNYVPFDPQHPVPKFSRLQTVTYPAGEVLSFTYSSSSSSSLVQVESSLGYALAGDILGYEWEASAANLTLGGCIGSSCSGPTYATQQALGRSQTTSWTTSVGLTTLTVTNPAGGSPSVYGIGNSIAAKNRVQSVSNGANSWTYIYQELIDAENPQDGILKVTVSDQLGNRRIVRARMSNSHILSDENGVGGITNFIYSGDGTLTGTGILQKIIYPEGNSVEYSYDSRLNVTAMTTYPKSGAATTMQASYPATCANIKTCNKPDWIKDARGAQTDFTYDPTHGGVLTVTRPDPGNGVRPQTRFTYQAFTPHYVRGGVMQAAAAPVWRLTQTSECVTGASCAGTVNEKLTIYNYEPGGSPNNARLLSVTTRAGDNSVTSMAAMAYNARGDVITTDGPVPGLVDYVRTEHDASRQVTSVITMDPEGDANKRQATRTTYRPDGQVSTVETGTATNWSITTFSPVQTTTIAYDNQRRKITTSLTAGGAIQTLTQYGYDAAGRLDCVAVRMNPATYSSLPASACTPGTAGSDGPDRITKTAYDNANRVVSTTIGWGVDPMVLEAKAYTVNGQVDWVEDGEGNRTTYVYDGFDRLKKVQYPVAAKGAHASNTTAFFEEYEYDANGNRTSVRRRDGQMVGMVYDALNRVQSKTLPATTYGYDNLGRQTSAVLTADGRSVASLYDALGQLKRETSPIGAVNYLYDAGGRRTRITWPDTTYVEYGYYVDGGLKDLRLNGSAASADLIAQFTYDDLGRRENLTRGNGVTSTYGYDPASRLNSLSHNPTGTADDVTFAFRSSPASQITDRTISNTAYVWQGRVGVDRGFATGGDNRLLTTGLTGGATDATYGYDGRANLTSDGVRTYTYDVDNRLTGTSSGAALVYDPVGRLYQTTTSGGTVTRYLYDGPNLIGEYTGAGAGSLLRRYVHGPGEDEPLMWLDTDVAKRWLLADHQGSIIAATNGAGTIQIDNATTKKEINTYDEYGLPGASNKGRFQYTGQTWLADVSLYHYKARVYSPTLGRFLQTDPTGYGDGLNWYAYVGNDPMNKSDPTGEVAGCTGDGLVQVCEPPSKGNCGRSCYESLVDDRALSNGKTPYQQCGWSCSSQQGEQDILADQAAEDNWYWAIPALAPVVAPFALEHAVGAGLQYVSSSNIIFKTGHYAPRLEKAGVNVRAAERAVRKAIASSSKLRGEVVVKGQRILYKAFVREGKVSVGTIHIPYK